MAEDCPASVRTVLRIERQTVPPRLDDTLGIPEIARTAGVGSDASFVEKNGLGMFAATLSYATELSGEYVAVGAAGVCATPKEVVLRIGYVGKVIRVARQIRDDACLAGIVLDHEKKHMVADETALERFLGYLGGDLQFALVQLRVPPAATPEAARRQFGAATGLLFERSLPALTRLREQLGAAVDAPDDPTRLAEGCATRDGAVTRQAQRTL